MASEIRNRFTDTEMQIARETDLPELLSHLGYQVKRVGRFYTTAEMDSLRIKDRRIWFRYVPNRLGGFRSTRQEPPRPLCSLLGQDGNIFHLMGIAARVLRQNGMAAEAKEMQTRIMGGACHSYEEALGIISEYVETELSPPRENRTKKKEKHEHER